MLTRRSQLRASTMAVAVGHHRRPGFGPKWSRRFRLRSFPHPDLLDIPSTPHFQRSRSTPCFSSSIRDDTEAIARVEIAGCRSAPGVHALVVEAAVAMAFGARPVPAASGLGGAYFLLNPAGDRLAVLKPVDEEPLALSALGSVRAGETGVREAAAYLLDHAGFAGVPPTALIRISHPAFSGLATSPESRVASIQRFVPHDFDAGDLGPSRFSIASVHRIGILDVRLLNMDRHAGNLLVANNGGELVPIDHGLCLPEILDDPYFEWLHWPQSAVPFSDLEAEYVAKLDAFHDAELLRAELPSLRESAIRLLILCTVFLQRAVLAGLCLADIGDMMTRNFGRLDDGASVLEALCKKAGEAVAELGSDGSYHGDERKECQFVMECKGAAAEEVLDIPLLLRSKNKRALDPLQEEDEGDGKEDIEEWKLEKGGGMMMKKSASFSAGELNHEGISFKGMSEEQWRLFLEKFEQLLQEAFEARKSVGVKQRLGSSCSF